MLQKDEVKYIESEIKKAISNITKGFFQKVMREEFEEGPEEYPGWTESWLQTRITDLYYLILAYLEGKEMPELAKTFKTKFENKLGNESLLLERAQTHPESEAEELVIINNFKQFLDAFKSFNHKQSIEDEAIKLTSILENTDFILKNCKSQISNEADIYKEVKWVLSLYYTSLKSLHKASFIQKFKIYNPDILIPELKTAVEYKYIKDKSQNIDEFIDQVRTDATNYVDDYRYENFIAVLYLEDASIATPQNIRECWKSKKFPINWDLIIVTGSPNKRKSKILK